MTNEKNSDPDDSGGWNAGAAANIYESGRQQGLREAVKLIDEHWTGCLGEIQTRKSLVTSLTQPLVEKETPNLQERAEVLLMTVSVMDGELTKDMLVDAFKEILKPILALRPADGNHSIVCDQNYGDPDKWIKENDPPYEGWCCQDANLRQTIDALYAPAKP